MIRVLIVDDQSLIREGLRLMLNLYEDIVIVAEATNGEEAIEIVRKEKVDLILMDIRMPVMDGIESTGVIKKEYPHAKILILTTFDEDEYIFHGLENGADGYLLKDISSEELVNAIRTVYSGNFILQPKVAQTIVNVIKDRANSDAVNYPFNSLTQREKEICSLVAEGRSNKEIGAVLFITEGTVKNHLSRILDKLELRDRTQLALLMKKK